MEVFLVPLWVSSQLRNQQSEGRNTASELMPPLGLPGSVHSTSSMCSAAAKTRIATKQGTNAPAVLALCCQLSSVSFDVADSTVVSVVWGLLHSIIASESEMRLSVFSTPCAPLQPCEGFKCRLDGGDEGWGWGVGTGGGGGGCVTR